MEVFIWVPHEDNYNAGLVGNGRSCNYSFYIKLIKSKTVNLDVYLSLVSPELVNYFWYLVIVRVRVLVTTDTNYSMLVIIFLIGFSLLD